MSVINQVLTQLEQRGARPAPEQTMVRAVVPYAKRNFAMPLVVLGVVLLAVFASWQSARPHKSSVAAGNIARNQTIVSVAAPSSGVTAVPVVAGAAAPAEMPLPAARPSPDASSAPPAATTHEVTKSPVQNKVAAPVTHQVYRRDEGRAAKPPVSTVPGTGASSQTPQKPVQPQLVQTVPASVQAAVQTSSAALPEKRVSPAQQADAEFRKANALMQQGRTSGALEGYEAVLRLDPGHDVARRALVALLLEGKRGADAERVLQEGLKIKPEHTGFAMLLARLQVEHGAIEQATATLEKSLPYADAQADYQAFFAALLQRQNRHKEAITHYQIALQLVPDKGVWLMGFGISLQAVQRIEDARNAYRRALDSKTLSPDLQAFVQQKLKSL